MLLRLRRLDLLGGREPKPTRQRPLAGLYRANLNMSEANRSMTDSGIHFQSSTRFENGI